MPPEPEVRSIIDISSVMTEVNGHLHQCGSPTAINFAVDAVIDEPSPAKVVCMAVVLAKDRDKLLVMGSDCDEELAIVLLHTRLNDVKQRDHFAWAEGRRGGRREV